MTTEEVRVRLRTKLESAFGAEEASILMDRPPGGWNDLVTNQVLEARLNVLEFKLVAQMAELRGDLRAEMAELRAAMDRGLQVQTWRLLGAIFVAFGMFATLVRVT
ncbi:MAG: hypothetical protein MUP97_10245 [Acidimicrobiia bacterium]|jgi:hypothetical protein|nr:hypothetical protein [Acidimicrobiia bacterium]